MDINRLLYRNIKPGYQYEGLIPKYKGVQYDFDKAGNSNTYDTLKFMQKWVEKYHYQMNRIAPKLKGSTIENTKNKIYDFLYWHFQYKLDESLQQLYSPSAAWHFRKTGFDCKTFSILASCILTELGIPHSFRKVKQPGLMSGEWSHVYVIVHDRNRELVIDATSHTNTEVVYTQKYDVMLKHRGLAAPIVINHIDPFNVNGLACNCDSYQNNGLGLTIGGFNFSNLFSQLSCIGGSSLDQNRLKGYLNNIEKYYNGLFAQLNQALIQKNTSQISAITNEFFGNGSMFEQASRKNAQKGWNDCTEKNIGIATRVFNFYNVTVGAALQVWIDDNFTVTSTGQTQIYSSAGAESKYGFAHLNNTPPVVVNENVYNFQLKPKTIKAFEMTPYLKQLGDLMAQNKPFAFNAAQYLSGLATVVHVFSNSGNTAIDPTTGQIIDTGNMPIGNDLVKKDNSMLYGFGAVAAIAGVLFWPSIKKQFA